MSVPRLAAWIIGAAVCGAWLASAAGVTRQIRTTQSAPRPDTVVQLDALAADVQAQASRLKERLARAPEPNRTPRNPFRFSKPRSERRAPAVPIDAPPALAAPLAVSESPLELIGIAETSQGEGIVRTAMLTQGGGDLIMVTAGQRILGRYDVRTVGVDAVELTDIQTGTVRRLILR